MLCRSRPRRAADSMPLRPVLWLLAATLSLAACATPPPEPRLSDLGRAPRSLRGPSIEAQLEALEAELAGGAPWAALARGTALRQVRALSVEQANRVERAIDEAVAAAVLSARSADDFEAIDAENLPRRARATWAVAQARALLDEDELFEAFLALRDMERVHRTHHLRTQAGDLVYEAGSRLALDGQRVLFFFRRSTNAPQVLDYLVLQHPSHPRAPDAYLLLASIYEQSGRLELAVERYEDLLLYHPGAEGALEAELRVPVLRLQQHLRDDYDRQELVRAKSELERWLGRHGARPEVPASLVDEARAALADTVGRLVRNDLIVARFYVRVDEPVGARLHGQRALELARSGGLTELAEQADELLASLPAGEAQGPTPPEAQGGAESTAPVRQGSGS
jgi:hypothetical protein